MIPESVSREEFRLFRDEQQAHFQEVKDLILRLSDYQREQNSKVATHSATIAVHEERFEGMKGVVGKLTTAVTSLIVALFSWILYRFFHG